MRIWDVEPTILCRKHLLGEHRELHALWTILTLDKKGYRNHPETKRWVGRLRALYNRHEALVSEMTKRGYHHNSPLDKALPIDSDQQNEYVDSIEQQWVLLRNKPCPCPLDNDPK